MKTTYPYDPSAEAKSNRVTEIVDTRQYPNNFNLVIPTCAPFYRVGLEVKTADGSRRLIEGIDYWLALYYDKAGVATGKAVYGGVMLPELDGATLTYQTLGDDHMVTDGEIGRFLTSTELTDPRNIDFNEVRRYPVVVKPVDKPDNYEEAVELDEVVNSLDKLQKQMVENVGQLNDLYPSVINELKTLALRIHNHKTFVHDKQPHQHKYTKELLGALGEDETAIDSTLAYGRTLSELIEDMKHFGINENVVAGLLNKNLDTSLRGMLAIEDGKLIICGSDERGAVEIEHGEIRFKGDGGDIVITADVDNNERGVGVRAGSGMNQLIVPSDGGSGDTMYACYNGKILITEDRVLEYLYKPESGRVTMTTADTETIKFAGAGLGLSPLIAHADVKNATEAIAGLWRVTDNINQTGSHWGISQKAVTEVRDRANNLVDKSFTINGRPFGDSQQIEITAEELDIDNMDNTSPEDKPVTKALEAALRDKSLKTHKHDSNSLTGVPYASTAEEGLAQLHDVLDDTVDKAVTANKGYEVHDGILSAEADIATRLPAVVAEATSYGGPGYLPIPALGNYGHANYYSPGIYGEEEYGAFIYLVNLASSFGNEVYYQEAVLTETSGVGVSQNRTSVVYAPEFLTKRGRKADRVVRGYGGIFSIVDSVGESWLVLTRGTMDMTKHVGFKAPDVGHWSKIPFIMGDYVYITHLDTGLNNTFYLKRFPLSRALAGETVVWETVSLHGRDIYNNEIRSDSPKFAPIDMSEDRNAQSMVWRNDQGFWSGINPQHSEMNWDIGLNGSRLRLFGYQRAYCSNSHTSSYGVSDQTTCVDIELTTGRFTIHAPEKMKLTLDKTGIVSQDPHGLQTWPGIHPNGTSIRVKGKYLTYSAHWYGTHSAIRLFVNKKPENFSDFDMCQRKLGAPYPHTYTYSAAGPTPTPVESVRGQPCWLNNNTVVYHDLNRGKVKVGVNTSVPYPGDNGFGPTVDREVYTKSFSKLCRVPRVWLDGEIRNEGFCGSIGESSPTVCFENGDTQNEYIFEEMNGRVLRDKYIAAINSRGLSDANRFISGNIFLHIFGSLGSPIGKFAIMMSRAYKTNDKTTQRTIMSIYEVDYTLNGNSIIVSATVGKLIDEREVQGTTTSISGTLPENTQAFCYRTDEGILGFSCSQLPYISYVGNTGICHVQIEKNPDNSYWWRHQFLYYYSTNEHMSYHSKVGFMSLETTRSADAIVGRVHGKKSQDIRNRTVKDRVYVIASTAEEGWIIYFTQPIDFYVNQKLHAVPEQFFDLRQLFPDGYRNSTFFIHIELVGDTPQYKITKTRLQEHARLLYIGHAKTDNTRIIELYVKRVNRLGQVTSMLIHDLNQYAHGALSSSPKENSIYKDIPNLPIKHVPNDLRRVDSLASEEMLLNLTEANFRDVEHETGRVTLGGGYIYSRGNVYALTRYPAAAIYTAPVASSYPKPDPSCSWLAPAATYTPAALVYSYYSKQVLLKAGANKFTCTADDTAVLWIDGVQHNNMEGRREVTHNVSSDTRVMVVWRLGQGASNANSPCHIGFAIKNGSTVVDKSDASWVCIEDLANKSYSPAWASQHNRPTKVATLTVAKKAGYRHILKPSFVRTQYYNPFICRVIDHGATLEYWIDTGDMTEIVWDLYRIKE